MIIGIDPLVITACSYCGMWAYPWDFGPGAPPAYFSRHHGIAHAWCRTCLSLCNEAAILELTAEPYAAYVAHLADELERL